MSPFAREMLHQLALGPAWDGDLVSKRGRDELVERGLAERFNGGWQRLTRTGIIAAARADFLKHEGVA